MASLAGALATRAAPPRIARALSDRWWWPIYRGLEFHDLFQSWWFVLLLVALGLAAIASAVERLPRVVLAVTGSRARLTDDLARGLPRVERIAAGPDAAAGAERVAAAFRARGFDPATEHEGTTWYLFAERGRWAPLGEAAVWASLLALAAAGIAGAALGWQGSVEVREGDGFDRVAVATADGNAWRRRLPFAVRVDRLDAGASGAVPSRPPRASLSVLDGAGRAMRREAVERGQPFREAGVEVLLAGTREIPDDSRAALTVVDRASGTRRDVAVGPGEPIEMPGVTYVVEEYAPGDGELGPAVRVRRAAKDGSSTFWVFERRPDLDARSRPDRYALEFQGLRGSPAGLFRVVHRPAAPAVAAAALLLAVGLAWTFSATHRRLWARVEPGAIVLAGAADRGSARLAGLVAALRADLAAPEGKG